jgi:hypothetical protein
MAWDIFLNFERGEDEIGDGSELAEMSLITDSSLLLLIQTKAFLQILLAIVPTNLNKMLTHKEERVLRHVLKDDNSGRKTHNKWYALRPTSENYWSPKRHLMRQI